MFTAERLDYYFNLIIPEIFNTLKMVFISSSFAIIIGIILGILLYVTEKDGLIPCRPISFIIGTIVNIGRSVPFAILMIAIFPFTKFIVGKSIGVPAAIVALTIAAIPFVARIMETSFKEIDIGVIEATKAMGASNFEIIFKVLLPESIQAIISNITTTIINIVGYSAMAGMVGAGGLGDIAIKYGSQRYEYDILIISIVLLIIFVQVIQGTGNVLSKRIVYLIHKFKK